VIQQSSRGSRKERPLQPGRDMSRAKHVKKSRGLCRYKRGKTVRGTGEVGRGIARDPVKVHVECWSPQRRENSRSRPAIEEPGIAFGCVRKKVHNRKRTASEVRTTGRDADGGQRHRDRPSGERTLTAKAEVPVNRRRQPAGGKGLDRAAAYNSRTGSEQKKCLRKKVGLLCSANPI